MAVVEQDLLQAAPLSSVWEIVLQVTTIQKVMKNTKIFCKTISNRL